MTGMQVIDDEAIEPSGWGGRYHTSIFENR
jgi:hypothetical protein